MTRMNDPYSTSVDAESISRRKNAIIQEGKKHKRGFPDASRIFRQEIEAGGQEEAS